jgi:hypothetical protein
MSLKRLQNILAPLAFLIVLVGCERQGPLERAGEEVDEAVEDVRNGGETLGNQVDDAVDEVRDGINDAADELE